MSDSDGPTRRGALLAVAGLVLGAGGYGYGIRPRGSDRPTGGTVTPAHVTAVTAVAAAIYPPGVAVDERFVEERLFGRIEPRPGHFDGVATAIEAVDAHAGARFGAGIADLPAERRRWVLTAMGVPAVHPRPDGTIAERVRFYLVNDLLYVLFTAPRSRAFTGIDNPPGHPGGRAAYRHRPDAP